MDPISKYASLDKATIQRWDHLYLWHPFTQHKLWNQRDPLVIVAAEGDSLIDIDGRRYIDGVSSMWCVTHGHRHPQVDAAIRSQLNRVAHTTCLGLTHPLAAALAKRLIEIAPAGLGKVFYSDDGSTAVEVALKMAYAYWHHRGQAHRSKFVALENAYHGDTIGAVSVGGIDIFHAVFRPLLAEAILAPSPYCYRCKLGKSQKSCGIACADALGRILADNAEQVAAVILEPLIQGAGGMIVAPPGYLARVRQYCDRYDILLIADEVATGFGHTGTMFACEREGISPDLMCLGKGLTNGYLPLAATLTTDEIYNAFVADLDELKTFFHGHTFTGNPLACAAALASLEVFDSQKVIESLGPKTDLISERLGQMVRRSRWVGDVRQCGMMAGVEIVADKSSKRKFPYELQVGANVCMEARKHGVMLRPLSDTIVIFPPLSISTNNLSKMLDVIEECIDQVAPRLAANESDTPE